MSNRDLSPALYNGITLANFSAEGKTDSYIDLLAKTFSGWAISSTVPILSNADGRLSTPEAFDISLNFSAYI